MRHSLSISDFPDLPIQAFRKALGKNRPATLEGGKGGGPSAPDPYNVANAQTNLFQQNAAFNKALNLGNYSNPFGSQTSNITGFDPATGAPIYQTSVSANPQLQSLLNQQMSGIDSGLNNRLIDYLGNIGMQSQGIAQQYGGLFNQLNNGEALKAQQQGQDAAYQLQKQYLDPQYAQQEASMEAKLAAQGLAPGSQAYGNAYQNFNNQRQQAYSNAQNQAILTGSQLGAQNLQNQIAGMNAQGGMLQGQLGALSNDINSIGARAGLNQQGYQNLNAIAGLIPRYTGIGTSGANPADIANAFQNQYLGQLGQYNARQQGQNATASNLAGLFGNLGRANSLYNMFSGNGLAGYGSALSGLSPGLAGSLGDALGMSLGGTYGAGTQAGLDALLGSFNAGTSAAAAGGAAEAGAAGAAGAGAGGAGAGSLGLAAATAAPFLIAAGGMLGGLLGYSDDGTPYTRANDAWANAITKDPSLLQQYGQGDVSKYMQSMFGGSQWTPEQYQRAQDMLTAAAGGGSFFGNFLGAPEQGMGG